jgi:putative ABC transport system substrate-binding protein
MSRSPALATAICLLLTCAAAAQAPAKSARIGMLCPVRCAGIGYTAFDDELRKLGWVEGRNLTIERRGSEGRYERLPELAAELVRLRPDLITAASSQPAQAAKEATSEIPVVFSFVADPVGMGLVQSLARPGGNITGVTALVSGEYIAKEFEILRELLPKAQRVVALTNPTNEDARLALLREVPMASQFGLQIDVIEARGPEEIPDAVAKAKRLGADALLVLGDSMLTTPANRIPDLATQAAIPAIYQTREPVLAGGLIAYSPDFLGIARRHAHYVDRILRGAASPADLPIEQPTKYDLVINLKTAETLGLTVPPSLLSRADEVIE